MPATASYNANNQVTWTTVNSAVNGFQYDASGDVTNDNANTYLYDAEGRVCAVKSAPVNGLSAMTGYLYDGVPNDRPSSLGRDAEGRRVAKGTITSMSCDPSQNGFTAPSNHANTCRGPQRQVFVAGVVYVLGQGGEELTEFSVANGVSTWQRTNVYGGSGMQVATYDTVGLHFQIDDPLGTPGSPTTGLRRWGGGSRRMQVSDVGQPETDIQSLPFGDDLSSYPDPDASTSDDATPLHFTGKERDQESGNDYFGARYYESAVGRWLSPDWAAKLQGSDPVPYARLDNPQSLNLYAYVLNNPLSKTDPDGHTDCSGKNAQGAGCQFNAAWDAKHGINTWNTVHLNLGGVKVDVRYILYRREATGGSMDITATPKHCADCRWGQAINAYDGQGERKDGGSPGTPLYGNRGKGDNVFYDTPSRAPSGQFAGTALLGFAGKVPRTNGRDINTFSVFGAFKYGFNAGANGNLQMTMPPTATSPSEGVQTLQRDTPGWLVQ